MINQTIASRKMIRILFTEQNVYKVGMCVLIKNLTSVSPEDLGNEFSKWFPNHTIRTLFGTTPASDLIFLSLGFNGYSLSGLQSLMPNPTRYKHGWQNVSFSVSIGTTQILTTIRLTAQNEFGLFSSSYKARRYASEAGPTQDTTFLLLVLGKFNQCCRSRSSDSCFLANICTIKSFKLVLLLWVCLCFHLRKQLALKSSGWT